MKRSPLRDVLYIVMIASLLIVAMNLLRNVNREEPLSYGEMRELFEAEVVSYVEVKNNMVHLELSEPVRGVTVMTYPVNNFELFYEDFNDMIVAQHQAGIINDYDYQHSNENSMTDVIFTVLAILFIVFILWYIFTAMQLRKGGGMSGKMSQFNKAKTKTIEEIKSNVTFADVAGAEEEKEELKEVVEFLKNPERFIELGARIPKGILLVGPPGTGKTLLAKAVAGEAGVNFASISGSDFVELYVGIGASRVRDLFEQAKKEQKSIIFIDEIDAVGRQRGTGLGGGHDEREQTLNQLLVEMDGFATNEGTIVLAATNRADILDPALLRPGRFDRQIYVGYPDVDGREEILKIYAKNKPLAEDVNLSDLAKGTSGFTGADLENIMNEAALLAARNGKPYIQMKDMDEAVLKVMAGPEKKSRVVPEHARVLTAYHEAGHAIVIHALETQDPVHQISIVPRGRAGGLTISLPQEDRPYRSRKELTERICTCLGGRVAEEIVLGDSSTGASNDLQTATGIARAMVTKYGMSKAVGTISLDEEHEVFIGRSMTQGHNYSEEMASIIDKEIKEIINEAYARCETILTEQRDALEIVAKYLLEHETMTQKVFEQVFTEPELVKQMKKSVEEKTN